MTDEAGPDDEKINLLIESMADVITAEMPELGFVLIMGRSAATGEDGSLLSLSNLDEETTVLILETVLARRRFLASKPETSVQ